VAKKPAMILYHTGLIVENLDDAMETMGDALGLDWFTPRKATSPFQSPGGILDREVRFTYSLQGPHFIEILEQIDPAPYLHVTGGRRIHHLGYYTEDLPGAARWLEDHGYRMELNGVDHDGNVARATFHYNPESPGMWIELVSHEVATEVGTELAKAAEELGIDFRSPFP
jgi:glyoxalase/bleomycin resistance protein/dioxygenase superfamily protein